jgi:hypothetical protein
MLRINKLNEDLRKREKMILVMEKILKEYGNNNTKIIRRK